MTPGDESLCALPGATGPRRQPSPVPGLGRGSTGGTRLTGPGLGASRRCRRDTCWADEARQEVGGLPRSLPYLPAWRPRCLNSRHAAAYVFRIEPREPRSGHRQIFRYPAPRNRSRSPSIVPIRRRTRVLPAPRRRHGDLCNLRPSRVPLTAAPRDPQSGDGASGAGHTPTGSPGRQVS